MNQTLSDVPELLTSSTDAPMRKSSEMHEVIVNSRRNIPVS